MLSAVAKNSDLWFWQVKPFNSISELCRYKALRFLMFKKVGIISVLCDLWATAASVSKPRKKPVCLMYMDCYWDLRKHLSRYYTSGWQLWEQSALWCSAALWTACNWPWDHILGPGTELCLLGSLGESSLSLSLLSSAERAVVLFPLLQFSYLLTVKVKLPCLQSLLFLMVSFCRLIAAH